jgi:hypothetical protein
LSYEAGSTLARLCSVCAAKVVLGRRCGAAHQSAGFRTPAPASVFAAPSVIGRHPKPFTIADKLGRGWIVREVPFAYRGPRLVIAELLISPKYFRLARNSNELRFAQARKC